MNLYIIIAPAMAVAIWFVAYANYHVSKEAGSLTVRVNPELIYARLNIFAAIIFGLLLLIESGRGMVQVLLNGNRPSALVFFAVDVAVVVIAAAYAIAIGYVARRILRYRRRVVDEEIEAVRDRVRREFDKKYGDEIHRLKEKVVNFHTDAGLDRYGQEINAPNPSTIAMIEAHAPKNFAD